MHNFARRISYATAFNPCRVRRCWNRSAGTCGRARADRCRWLERSSNAVAVSGYYIEEYDPQDFGTYTFQLADDKEQKVEGRYWKIEYWLKDGAKKGGPVEIGRNYASLLTQRGGRKIYDTLDAGGGTLTARMPAGGKNIWLEVDVSNSGEVYELTVVEEAAMAQQVEFTAMELARILNEQGSVALHGILFDTGRATIRDESKGALQSVGDLLKQQAALRLEIQGTPTMSVLRKPIGVCRKRARRR